MIDNLFSAGSIYPFSFGPWGTRDSIPKLHMVNLAVDGVDLKKKTLKHKIYHDTTL